jgi:predicted nucleic acid-binding protein
MTAVPSECVVDASVGIKLFIDEPLSDRADLLFASLAAGVARFYVPDLFYIECANILWKYVRRSGYPANSARQDLEDLDALDLHSVSTADLMRDALEIAISNDITAYDACYVALAHRLGVPLVTADAPLADRMEGSEYAVVRLHEFAPPAA